MKGSLKWGPKRVEIVKRRRVQLRIMENYNKSQLINQKVVEKSSRERGRERIYKETKVSRRTRTRK